MRAMFALLLAFAGANSACDVTRSSRNDRESRSQKPAREVDREKASQSPSIQSRPVVPEPSPCELLERRTRSDRDWRREASRFFEAEHVGYLFKFDRPGSELDVVKKGFEQFREGIFTFHACPSAILVFTRVQQTPQCQDKLPDFVPRSVGEVAVLHCFDRKNYSVELAQDCLDDVISKQRCRTIFAPRATETHCGSGSRDMNYVLNELFIYLDLAPQGSRICID